MTADARDEGARPARAPGLWIPLGRIRGVGLYLDPVLPVLVAALVATGVLGTETARDLAFFLLFVLLHEAGHAVAARRRGLAVSGIYIHLLSATWVERGTPADVWRVALGGPAASLAAGLSLLLVRALIGPLPDPSLDAVLADGWLLAAAANLAIGLLNLLPVLPADGGRALRALLEERTSRRSAALATGSLGLAVGMVLLLVALLGGEGASALYLGLLGAYLGLVGGRVVQAA